MIPWPIGEKADRPFCVRNQTGVGLEGELCLRLARVRPLNFQAFREPAKNLAEWHARTGKPVLWADGAGNVSAKDPFTGERVVLNGGDYYRNKLAGLRENPGASARTFAALPQELLGHASLATTEVACT